MSVEPGIGWSMGIGTMTTDTETKEQDMSESTMIMGGMAETIMIMGVITETAMITSGTTVRNRSLSR
jgi:hypothetical protein